MATISLNMLQSSDAIKQNESEVEIFLFCFVLFFVLFLHFSIRVLFKLSFGENPMEIGQLVLEK